MQPAVNKPDKVKGNGKGEEETQDALPEGEQAGIDAATQALFGLPQEGNEDIYQTFGYDGDGNRLFSTVTITKYAPPFEEDMPLPPGKEKTNNGKGSVKKQLSLMSVPELVIYLAKSDSGKGKGSGGSNKDKGNNGKESGNTKEKTNNGLHLGWYKRADHPHYPGTGEVIEEEFRAANYVNDINREYPEVLMVSDAEGNYTASYLYGLERIMAENVEGLQPERFDPLYYLYNGLGSAAQLVNGDGEVWNKFMYEPYGRPRAAGKLLLNRHKEELLYVPFGFTGEAHDFYSGLIYLRARYYDPEVGSFISRDSYLGSLMRPLSQNRYTYVENNPVNYVDPSGHELVGPFDHTIIPRYKPNLDTLGEYFQQLLDNAPKNNIEVDNNKEKCQEVFNDNDNAIIPEGGINFNGYLEKMTGLDSYDVSMDFMDGLNPLEWSDNSGFLGNVHNFQYGIKYIAGGKASIQILSNGEQDILVFQRGGGLNIGSSKISGTGFSYSTGLVVYNTNKIEKLYGVTGDYGLNINTTAWTVGGSMVVGEEGLVGMEYDAGPSAQLPGIESHAMVMRTQLIIILPKCSDERIREIIERH